MSNPEKSRTKKIRAIKQIARIIFIIGIPLVLFGVMNLPILNEPAKADGNRVVILGFDGMDHNLVDEYLEQGELPNFGRVRDMGIFHPLRSTTPPESPVAWSAFITGTNPGKTGIFDFLRRNPETYFPELNMTDVVSGPEFLFDTIPFKPPVLRNNRQGTSYWAYAAEAGVDAVGVMMPMNMPPDEADGSRVLSGLGVPDMRRTMGTYVYYVDDREVAIRHTGSDEGTEMGGRVIEVIREGNEVETFLPGPYDPVHPETGDELKIPVTMTVNPDSASVEFRIHNQTPFNIFTFFGGAVIGLILSIVAGILIAKKSQITKEETIVGESVDDPVKLPPSLEDVEKEKVITKQKKPSSTTKGFAVGFGVFIVILGLLSFICRPTNPDHIVTVSEGEWSDWIPAQYMITSMIGAEGFFRIFLIEAEPDFQLYVTPVNIDPRGTKGAVLSYPANFAPGLLDRFGNFKTYGWDSETWALNENVIEESVFLEDLLGNWDLKAGMVVELMKEDGWDLFSAVFQGTDHTSHMFWRFVDETHPMYDPEMAEEFGDAILTVYQRADALIGRVLDEILEEGDELIVMSDHGFQTWHKAVNLNRWLVDNGYLAEKQNLLGSLLGEGSSVSELFGKDSEFFQWVDWSRSRAYALGLGQIYINLEGRESQGIVTGNERDALIDEIIEGLRTMVDPETGQRMLVGVYRADEIYEGDNMEYSPDIVVGFGPGYRVSWQTTLGVAAEDLVELNARKWSGDHCSFDPSVCNGILFSTVPITVNDPTLIDLTPSILSLFGIEKPARCDGRIIF